MEVMNENRTPRECGRRRIRQNNVVGSIFLGSLLIITGLVWLLHNLDVLPYYVFEALFSWQMLLVAVGGYLIASRKYVAGGLIGGLGILFVAADLCNVCIPMGKVALPAVIIAVGAAIILTKLGRR